MMHRFLKNLRIARRRGFSFVEVMFAVIILGIGFIMVSAMFPVAIQQTQMNVEDAAVGRVTAACQANFTAIAQDMSNYTNFVTTGAVSYSYYGWPITRTIPAVVGIQTAFPGAVYSFRDSRWIPPAYTVNPTVPAVPVPPQPSYLWPFYNAPAGTPAAKYPPYFALASNAANLAPFMQIGLWDRVRGGMIMSAEPQYAYVPLFQRGYLYNAALPLGSQFTADSQVNLYVFVASARNRTPYTYTSNAGVQSDVLRNPYTNGDTASAPPAYPPAPASLEPRLVGATFHLHTDFPGDAKADPIVDRIEIFPSANGSAISPDAAGPGGFAIISDDNPANSPATPLTVPPFYPGALNGNVRVRLGALVSTPVLHDYLFELQPGYDVPSSQAALLRALPNAPAYSAIVDIYILGKQLQNPDLKYSATNVFDGPVQDLWLQQLPPISTK